MILVQRDPKDGVSALENINITVKPVAVKVMPRRTLNFKHMSVFFAGVEKKTLRRNGPRRIMCRHCISVEDFWLNNSPNSSNNKINKKFSLKF